MLRNVRAAAAAALALSCALAPGGTLAQEAARADQGTTLRVFLDCQRCDFDHLRREVTFVDYVRQPADAQVHVLVTSQSTGGGGQEYTLYLIGQGPFASRQDTLRFITDRDDTDEVVRAALTHNFALALVPYAARTPIAPDLTIGYERPDEESPAAAAAAADPWNLWVFRVGVGTSLDGESRQNSASLNGSWSASRTTDRFKVNVSADGRYETEHFELNDGRKLTSIARNWGVEGITVWSIGAHWSAGVYGALTSSTRLNQELNVLAAPALEYNVYPYSQSTRRQILFTYAVGAAGYRYHKRTLFDKLRETLPIHQLQVTAGFQQPWGEVDGSLELTNYLNDFSKHRIELDTGIEIRLFRGLNLDVRGNVARIKDQIYISAEDLTDEEILLELRELGTDFEYELDIGFSYSFGSRFNNVVNPRLRL
jgi:hypothetical protein